MKKYIAFGLALILSCANYAQDKIKVACVGNSITYGSGVADREVNAYPVKLQGISTPQIVRFPALYSLHACPER